MKLAQYKRSELKYFESPISEVLRGQSRKKLETVTQEQSRFYKLIECINMKHCTVGPLCPLGPAFPVRPWFKRKKRRKKKVTDTFRQRSIIQYYCLWNLSLSFHVFHSSAKKLSAVAAFKSFIKFVSITANKSFKVLASHPCSLLAIWTRESRESKRSLKTN